MADGPARRNPDDVPTAPQAVPSAQLLGSAWRSLPPILRGPRLTLREPSLADARLLRDLSRSDELWRFVPTPPVSAPDVERFLAWARDERACGRYLSFGLVPDGADAAVGVFQLRPLEPSFGTVEWTFALAPHEWGSGLFFAAAPLVVDFVFDVLGACRLEARVAPENGRAGGVLRKLGAAYEGLLRQAVFRRGEYLDQALWTLASDEWRSRRARPSSRVH